MSDKHFSQVMILAGFDGVDGATAFTEESAVGRIATFLGNAQLDTAQVKWGTASLLLDGAGDAVSFPDAADLSLLNGDFTVEGWARFAAAPSGTQTFWSHYSSGSNQRSWFLDYTQAGGSGNDLRFAYSTAGTSGSLVSVVTPWTPVANTWYHLAASRTTTALRLFIDGVQQINHNVGAASFHNTTAAWTVGCQTPTLITNPFNGWIDEVRLTVGRGRYTANFTPPQGPFSRGKRLGQAGEGVTTVVVNRAA